jgi:hypothetical protein
MKRKYETRSTKKSKQDKVERSIRISSDLPPPLFLNLVARSISSDLFNSLLSHRDLSILLQTCKRIKAMILEWPVEHIEINKKMDDNMLKNMILHYSRKIRS